ncbi:MAG: Phosphoglycolate phosphatase [Syntrophus sp. PtaB.Bin001]|jgi:phosphoglycolate phosphatase|nr:MAG: Phosphoglycolate phosphatase [Syntrophus sp. PtaB.Bin001]
MKSVELMVFDFDGTLVDTGKDLVNSVNHTLKQLSLAILPEKKIISFIGDGVQKLIERSLGQSFPGCFEEAMEIFDKYYTEHLLDSTKLYPGIKEVLRHFDEKRKIIITNKRHHFTVQITDALHITNYFDEIVGADSRPYRKPDSRLVETFIEKYRVPQGKTIVVGDGINDVLLAKNAGVISCAFLNGLGSREDLLSLNPDYTCEEMNDLIKLFY